jgi:hypothetical protein
MVTFQETSPQQYSEHVYFMVYCDTTVQPFCIHSSQSFVLTIAPNLIKVGDPTTIRITNAQPGKSVELEVRGSSGVYNARSIKGLVKLDGTFSIGPVGVDNGYSDYLTITAWVDGFRVVNTADVKVTDGTTITGPAMISTDKEIYQPYDYITYAIADGTPGGKVTGLRRAMGSPRKRTIVTRASYGTILPE